MYPTRFSTPLTGLDWLQWYGAHKVYHPGVDFNYGSGWDDFGQDIVAAKKGTIEYIYTGWNHRGFGNFVIIKHEDGNYSRYAHMDKVRVVQGNKVNEGSKIGTLGNTGTQSPHLHFEIFNEKMAVIQRKHWNPWRFYPSNKSKQYVTEHYLNPWTWLDQTSNDTEMEKAIKWAIDRGIATNFNGTQPTKEEVALMLYRYNELKKGL